MAYARNTTFEWWLRHLGNNHLKYELLLRVDKAISFTKRLKNVPWKAIDLLTYTGGIFIQAGYVMLLGSVQYCHPD